MCYSEFNDVIESIAAMDADVITIETSRSDMELLEAFEQFDYPNEIGPGVYDIHSPRVPSREEIVALLRKAARRIPAERLWVSGLRPEDPRLAGNRGGAGEHGRRCPRTAWRPRLRLTGGPGERNGTPGVPFRVCTSVQRGVSTSARSTWSSQTPAIFR